MKGKHSEESRKKISETRKRLFKERKLISYFKGRSVSGKNNPMYGIRHTKESKKKISESIIKAHKEGRLISPFKGRNVCGKKNPMFNKFHSEESKKRMSDTRKRNFKEGKIINYWKDKHIPNEIKNKMSISRKKLYKEKEIIPYWKDKSFSEAHKNNLSFKKKDLFLTGKNIPWNKGLTGEKAPFYGKKHTEKTKNKMKEFKKHQIKVFTSKPELKVQNFLKSLNTYFIPHKYMSEINHPYQCDVFIPSLNLVIECDGDYWHGNPLKYSIPNEKQKKQIERDIIRTKELEEKGYKVLRLWQEEINSMMLQDFKLKIKKINN